MVDPYVNLGNAYKELGRLDESLAYYRHAIELEPNNPMHYSNLGVNSTFTLERTKRSRKESRSHCRIQESIKVRSR